MLPSISLFFPLSPFFSLKFVKTTMFEPARQWIDISCECAPARRSWAWQPVDVHAYRAAKGVSDYKRRTIGQPSSWLNSARTHSPIEIPHFVIIFFSKYVRSALHTKQLDVYKWVSIIMQVATSHVKVHVLIHCQLGQSSGTTYGTSPRNTSTSSATTKWKWKLSMRSADVVAKNHHCTGLLYTRLLHTGLLLYTGLL